MGKWKIIFLVGLMVLSFRVQGQLNVTPQDAAVLKSRVEGFYTWYFKMISDHRLNQDFNPRFVKKKNGMTELDFTKYTAGLRKYKFSEAFLQRKIREYRLCNEHLGRIPFAEYLQFDDLDDYERINCDFSNRFEWTGGMEPKESAQLSKLTRVDAHTIRGQINFTSYSKPDGKATVTFKKIGREWMIDDLKLEP